MEAPPLPEVSLPASPKTNARLAASASEADVASLLLGAHAENLPTVLEYDSTEEGPFASGSAQVNSNINVPEEDIEEQESLNVAAVLLEVPARYSPAMDVEEEPPHDAPSQNQVDEPSATNLPESSELPPNYPPVIYPAVNPVAPQAAKNDIDERMEVDNFVHEGPSIEAEEMDEDEHEDEEMDEDEDETASSEVSNGEDLVTDLETALNGDFGFKGSFSYASILSNTPNPCLFIVGLGLVGMPLSERDAKLIIRCSAQAPYGHGERTVVNTDVRDTWEIDPAKIRFGNPAWEPYVQELATKSVFQALGVLASTTPPQCELYKLLLYEQGSHFLPHQDTQKANGMFATVIILLPSAYSGGQVHVSHGAVKKVFDLASSSLTTSAILAWYTDVMHEVKPVTSGYRLALSYNLIQANPGIPRPSLPDMNGAVTYLRQVLRKWKKEAYAETPESDNMIAYILGHQYSEVNLNSGIKSLKGEDAHRVANLRDVAEELGYVVCLGNLDHNVTGSGEDDCGYRRNSYRGYHGWKRRRYDYYDDEDEDEDEIPTMGEVMETNTTIKHLVDLDGNVLMTAGFAIDGDCLIPRDPFEDVDPDDKEYEGYMGNGAGQLDYWYHRTVLVIFHEDDPPSALHSTRGTHYALHKLLKSTSGPPSAEDRKIVNLILQSISSHNAKTSTTMADFALKWNDAAMWKAVILESRADLRTFGVERLVRAWQCFSFAIVKPIFEHLASHIVRLNERLGFIQSLPRHAPPTEQDAVNNWCRAQSILALSSYKSPVIEDVPVLLQAWKQFESFETVRTCFETLASHITGLKERLDFIQTILPQASDPEQDAVKKWCREQSSMALSSHNSPKVGDVPALIQAWSLFSFETVKKQFEAVASSISVLKDRLNFIQTISSHVSNAEQETVKNWCREQSIAALSSQKAPTLHDVPALIQIWKELSFEIVHSSFKLVVSHINSLKERLEFVQTLPPHASSAEKEAVNEHCEKLYSLVLTSYKSPSIGDVPVLVSVAREKGIAYINQLVLARLLKTPSTYSFWIALIKALQENRTGILEHQAILPAADHGSQEKSMQSTPEAFDSALDQSLDAAALQWEDVPAQTGNTAYSSYYNTQQHTKQSQEAKITRIIELVELSLWTGRMSACRKLFILLLKSKEGTTRKFQTLYIPLIPKLKELLNKKKTDLCSTPFIDFMQLLIGTYLRDMLGSKGRNPRPKLRKIGCGCADCGVVDIFMNNPNMKDQTFRMAMARRTHLESRLRLASDLVTFVTIRTGSPHGVHVTKLPDVIAASQWDGRQAQARSFLTSIGSSDLISKLMRGRYQDVLKAVVGSQPFVLAASNAAVNVEAPLASSSRGGNLASAAAAATDAQMFTAPSRTPVTAPIAPSNIPGSGTPSSGSALAMASGIAASSATRTPSITSTSGMPSAARMQASGSHATAKTSVVAGVKRKKGPGRPVVQLGPVIDLTGDDSS